jgi:hypothetical protein
METVISFLAFLKKVVRFTIEQLEKEWPSNPRLQALQKLSDLDQELGLA